MKDSFIQEWPDSYEPEGAVIQWRHYDALAQIVGTQAVKAAKAEDFRYRAFYQYQERTLDEILSYLRTLLPERRGENEKLDTDWSAR